MFEKDSLVQIHNVGVQRVVNDYGHLIDLVNDETGAVVRVPVEWCELVEAPLATQADDLGAAMAAAEAAPTETLLVEQSAIGQSAIGQSEAEGA